MKNKIKAVIFDVDGTLIDSNDFHAYAWVKAFDEFGKAVSFIEVRPQIGKGADTLLPEFLSKKEIKEFGEKAGKRRAEIFKKEFIKKVKPFAKVRELFKKLKADDIKFALASSAEASEVKEYEKIAKIEDLVEKSTSSEDAETSKPAPDIFQAALKKLKLKPSEVIIVGDTPYDAIAACKAKIKIIGVLSGGFPKRDLEKEGCLEIYKDIADLLSNYEKSAIFK